MEKSICAFIFAITFVALSGVVHGQPSRASRGPSVEPIVEVDIEDAKKAETADTGYNFSSERAPSAAKSRVPANIVSKTQTSTPSSYIGPLIFLFALPFALWIMVSKKFKGKEAAEKSVGYYPKNQQFKPFKTDYQQSAEDDDDIDYPKAS